MNNVLGKLDEILAHQICGFHQYILTDPVHLNYVSSNLCEMVGVREEELLDDETDRYLQLIHPADREKYSDFIKSMMRKEQSLASEYRLLKRDGTVIYVRDTIKSKRTDGGILIGDSVLTDITDIRNENSNLQFLNETIPCGFLRYTCEKHPRITYINQKMMELLRFPNGKERDPDDLELYQSNVFLMIPAEERRRFAQYLKRVYLADAPVAGEMTLLRCDGTRIHVFGWVTKSVGEDGNAEFQSVCMDVTERYQMRKAKEGERYMEALSDVFDKIFEFNLDANTVKCLHCEEDSYFKRFQNIAMQTDDALETWLLSSVASEYRDDIRKFFQDVCKKRLYEAEGKPPSVTYKARATNDGIKEYTGIFIKVDESISLYCCREMKEQEDSLELKQENNHLKEQMRDLVMQFSDGIAAFEVSSEGMVKPLYASENVYKFFGYTEEEWLPLTMCFTPLESFTAYSEATYDEFAALLKVGEAEFTYFDHKTKTERIIKAICSEKEPTSNASRFVMLYALDGKRTGDRQLMQENQSVSVRTFGYFDVFVGDTPIVFRNKKAKELLALLVDRKGGYVTSEEAIGFLWEDEPVNPLTLSRYRKVALRLKGTLEEYGVSHIIEAIDGKRRIVMDRVQCDLYQYLSGKEEHAQLFKGSYLTNYSWGERTLGELMNHRNEFAYE